MQEVSYVSQVEEIELPAAALGSVGPIARKVQWLAHLPERRRRRRHLRLKIYAIDSMLPRLVADYERAKTSGNRVFSDLATAGIYLLDLHRDLLGLMLETPADAEHEYNPIAARLIALQLYEASQDFPRLMGKLLKELVGALPEATDLRHMVGGAMQPIHEFYARNRGLLRSLRALKRTHRGLDGYERSSVVQKLKPADIACLLEDFDVLLTGIIPALSLMQITLSEQTIA